MTPQSAKMDKNEIEFELQFEIVHRDLARIITQYKHDDELYNSNQTKRTN